MDRQFYLNLAARGLRMPIGADLVLHEHPDHEEIRLGGARLGQVIEETAAQFRTPLAFPLMDLRLEKADLLAPFGVGPQEADTFHFAAPPPPAPLADSRPFPLPNQAHIGSVRYIAERTKLVAIGMAIGPFSLMTKLLADPITPLALAGMGVEAAEDPGVAAVERCLELAEAAVHRSVRAQIEAGARAMLICEPAASIVFLSPKQIEAGAETFERFVLQPHLRLKALLDASDVDLIFHDCGELTTRMVREFATRLDPAILSLGSSRRLWEDAAIVPKHVVLFGNLPSKSFYSDAAMPVEEVRRRAAELAARMRAAGHPHILGSECDVLYVEEAADTIRRKVEAMLA